MGLRSIFNGFFTRNADGFSLGGGIIERIATFVGGNMTFSGSGSNTMTMPSSSQTLVGRTSTDDMSGKRVALAAGSTSLAPLSFTSGTNKTTPDAGDIEYNGSLLYATIKAGVRDMIFVGQTVITTADYSTTDITTLQNVTPPSGPSLAFAAGANETWVFEFFISGASTTSAGINLALDVTSSATGCTLEAQIIGTNSATSFYSNRLNAFNTAATNDMISLNGSGVVRISGHFVNGSTAQSLILKTNKQTGGTATIYAKSFVTAMRVA